MVNSIDTGARVFYAPSQSPGTAGAVTGPDGAPANGDVNNKDFTPHECKT